MKRLLIIVFIFLLLICYGCVPDAVEGTETQTKTAETETVEQPPTEVTGIPAESETVPPPDPLKLLAEQMTLEEQVGQLFLVACPDADVSHAIETYHFGGFVLFGKDVEGKNPDTLKNFLEVCQQVSDVPMLIAVDEEGGSVCRISSHTEFRSERFSSPGWLIEQGGLDLLLQTETEKCLMLKKLGINVNLAPVCDIATDSDAFMYSRSFRQNPEDTAASIQEVVGLMNRFQMGSVLKHFPGYGNNADTHVAMAVDERTLETLEQADMLPFQAGIAAGAGAIMVSHTVVTALDDTMPASLSAPVHTYLREKIGFDGVIMTDDLIMEAITDTFGAGEAAVLAVLAGNDMLCTWEYETQYAAVLEAVQSGRIPAQQVKDSVLRILRWKQALGLLDGII